MMGTMLMLALTRSWLNTLRNYQVEGMTVRLQITLWSRVHSKWAEMGPSQIQQLLQTQIEIARMAKAIVDIGQALVSARETKRTCQRTARPPAVHVLHLQIQQLLQTQLLQTQIEIARMAKRIVDIGQALVSARETKRTCQRTARHLAINAAESCTDTTLERPWCMPLCMGC